MARANFQFDPAFSICLHWVDEVVSRDYLAPAKSFGQMLNHRFLLYHWLKSKL